MPAIRQTNFSAGELDPKFRGRTDLPVFSKGARTLTNIFVSHEGALFSRAGTEYLGEVKIQSGVSAGVRLVPFFYSDTVNYVLEVGAGYIRFWKDGALVNDANRKLDYDGGTGDFTAGQVVTGGTSGATGTIVSVTGTTASGTLVLSGITGTFVDNEAITDPITGAAVANGTQYTFVLEVATLFAAADLQKLQWAQTGDIITFTNIEDVPKELKRLTETSWTFTAVSFSPPSAYLDNIASAEQGNSIAILVEPLPVADATHPAREWKWKVTALGQDPTTGLTFESLPYDVIFSDDNAAPADSTTALPATIAVYPDMPVTVEIQRTVAIGAGTAPTYKPIAYNIYRGRGDVFGLVGQTKTSQFIDTGEEPNYAVQPPRGTNPFIIKAASGATARTEDPAAITFFQERRIFGGTTERGSFVFGSAVGDYTNYDPHTLHVDDEAVLFDLATQRREGIRSLFGHTKLIAGTNSSIWAIDGQQGEPLKFDRIDAKVVEAIGVNYLPMLAVEESILYARSRSPGVRAIVPANTPSGFTGVDLTVLARHLFPKPVFGGNADNSIVDLAYAEAPWGLVWAVRDDGVLLSLTYSKDSLAWAKHETDGDFLNACTIPEDGEDVVYVVVKRQINGSFVRYLERMTSRKLATSGVRVMCLDSALAYSGSATTTLTGLDYLEGEDVYVLCTSRAPAGPYTVASGTIELDEATPAGQTSWIGLPYTCDFESLDVIGGKAETALLEKTVTSVGIEVYETIGLQAGPDLDNLVEWQQRDVELGFDAPEHSTEMVHMPITGTWNKGARIAVRQSEPLPLAIVGITREVEFGS